MMPYELVFGQPPRSIFIPDAFFKGQINEEDIQPDKETETVEEDEDIELLYLMSLRWRKEKI